MGTMPAPETANSLMQEGKKLIVVGQIALLGSSLALAHESSFAEPVAVGQHLAPPSSSDESHVLAHPDVVQAFNDSADAIDAWENSL
jgi:hypothetical protein